MELARSSYYYRPVGETPRKAENRAIRARLEELALRFPRYGYRRMTAQLKREGFIVNHKRVLRILCARRSGGYADNPWSRREVYSPLGPGGAVYLVRIRNDVNRQRYPH